MQALKCILKSEVKNIETHKACEDSRNQCCSKKFNAAWGKQGATWESGGHWVAWQSGMAGGCCGCRVFVGVFENGHGTVHLFIPN